MHVALRSALVGTVALASLTSNTSAQSSGDGFLFRAPRGSFSIHGGYSVPRAGSDIFSEATSLLTIDKSDFRALAFGGDISYSLTPRFDLVFGGSFSSASKDSEYRNWVDNNDQPIEQSTNFKQVPLTVSLRFYLTDRGRAVSQFAWIPSAYSPYIGVGGGATWYRFRQAGDFIDFDSDNEVFPAELESSGWAPTGHAMAGLDYTIGPRLALTVEGRYSLGKAALDENVFQGFEKIDLAGFVGTVGFKVRF